MLKSHNIVATSIKIALFEYLHKELVIVTFSIVDVCASTTLMCYAGKFMISITFGRLVVDVFVFSGRYWLNK